MPNYNPSFDTPLSPVDEVLYRLWKKRYAPTDSGRDYDYRGAYAGGEMPTSPTGHFTDRFKKPNHPTFSEESQYAGAAPEKAGRWEGERYIPAGYQHGTDSVPAPDLTEQLTALLSRYDDAIAEKKRENALDEAWRKRSLEIPPILNKLPGQYQNYYPERHEEVPVKRSGGHRYFNPSSLGEYPITAQHGTDSVPAQLTPREAVLNRNASELVGRDRIREANTMGNMMAEQGIDLPTLYAQGGTEDVARERYYDAIRRQNEARPSPLNEAVSMFMQMPSSGVNPDKIQAMFGFPDTTTALEKAQMAAKLVGRDLSEYGLRGYQTGTSDVGPITDPNDPRLQNIPLNEPAAPPTTPLATASSDDAYKQWIIQRILNREYDYTYGPTSPGASSADRREFIGNRNNRLATGDYALEPRDLALFSPEERARYRIADTSGTARFPGALERYFGSSATGPTASIPRAPGAQPFGANPAGQASFASMNDGTWSINPEGDYAKAMTTGSGTDNWALAGKTLGKIGADLGASADKQRAAAASAASSILGSGVNPLLTALAGDPMGPLRAAMQFGSYG